MEWQFFIRRVSRGDAVKELGSTIHKGDRLCRSINYVGDIPSEVIMANTHVSLGAHYYRYIITDGECQIVDKWGLDEGPGKAYMAKCVIRNATYLITYDEADCGDMEWWDERINVYGDKSLYEELMREVGEYVGGICC